MPGCESAPPNNNSTAGNQNGGGKIINPSAQPNEKQPQKEPKRAPPMNFVPGKQSQIIQRQSSNNFENQSPSTEQQQQATSSVNLVNGVSTSMKNWFSCGIDILATVPNIFIRTFTGQ